MDTRYMGPEGDKQSIQGHPGRFWEVRCDPLDESVVHVDAVYITAVGAVYRKPKCHWFMKSCSA